MFPFASFYAFSGTGSELYEKDHHGLSLSSFPAFSSRKYYQENLVSFMLIKLFEWPSSQCKFNLFRPAWTTNGKEVSYPLKRVGELFDVHFYPFSDTGDYQQKIDPTGVFFMFSDSQKMKPSSFYSLGLTKNPWDCVITVSLGATTYITIWQLYPIGSPLFRVFYDESSFDPLDTTSPATSFSISHLQLSSRYYSYDPSPMS